MYLCDEFLIEYEMKGVFIKEHALAWSISVLLLP